MRTKYRKTLALAAAAVSTSWVHAQTVSNFTGGASGNGQNWASTTTWDTDAFPNAPDALAQFGSKTGAWPDLININFANASIVGTLEVSAIAFLPTFEAEAGGMTIRNSSSSTAGTMKIYGHSTIINGDQATLLIGNFSSSASGPIRFGLASQGYAIELNNSGVIHSENGLLQISNQITETGGSRSITKTGAGTLRLDDHSEEGFTTARHSTANSTYSGGFTLREGIVEWSAGGGLSASPFGTGALTLQGGNLRSTTTDSQTISNNVVLNGDIAFGSLSETFNGDIAINDANGERATVLASNSTLTVHNQVTWNQAISGDFALTKNGAGTLVLSGAGGEVSHTGATVVEEGKLLVNTNITASEVTVESGAILGFGTAAEAGQGSFNTLTLEADSFLSFRLNASDDFDSLLAFGEVGLSGANLDISLGFAPEVNDVFLLLDNRSGESLNGFLSYGGGVLAEGSEFTVTTGEFSQLFAITYQFNGDSLALTAIPEPSTWVLILGLASFGAAAWRRRR